MRRIVFLFAAASLIAVSFGAASAHAGQLRLIAGGWSYHLTDAATRARLNQTQNTLGFEVVAGHWNVQVSHMRDSFGCGAWEALGGRQFQLAHGKWGNFGVALDGIVAYRCTSMGEETQTWTTAEPPQTWNQVYAILYRHYPAGRPDFYTWRTSKKTGHTRWRAGFYTLGNGPRGLVVGAVPGLYLNLGSRLRVEAGLIYSTWSDRFVVYAQLSLLLYQWGGK